MKTLFNPPEYFNEDYYERGAETGKSLYSHYRWMPELTIPMAHHIAKYMEHHKHQHVIKVILDLIYLRRYIKKQVNLVQFILVIV